MSREDSPRAALSRAVAACRRALGGDRKKNDAGDIGAQLEAPYGFDPRTGVPRPMDQMGHLRSWQVSKALMLREWHAHLLGGAAGETEAAKARAAYDQMKYELGFTALHRLCALRMAEERGIVRECVRKGRDSEGFRLFLSLSGDSGLGPHEDAYTFFLARLYNELALDLPAVFDTQSAASLIVPGPKALGDVVAALSAPELAPCWSEEETLGWIFEDYNDADERKEMREHDAPRNARELAVRNQFFTPRWVVAFLTDNTLGRLWYDATAGETELGESCRFFLKPKAAPSSGAAAPRDPRTIKVLDPACGSGHFLLYVYDLLEVIYREAWRGRRQQSAGWKPLWEEFTREEALLREIPRLILEHNIHGVDIDPRCIQEAALVLWLRAHRSWDALGIRAKARPSIEKVNLVCAQALPDDAELRKGVRDRLKPPVLGRLLDALFVRVGEMGVLLRAETAIQDTVKSVKKDYLFWKSTERNLFGEVIGEEQTTLDDFAQLHQAGADEEFWKDADRLLLQALEGLAEEGEGKQHYRSRLFADEVRHGLEFFDISRIKYDVILMNPPFGAPSESTKEFLDGMYPNAGHDLYAMFYERALEMLTKGGRVGAITNRAWLALPTLMKFRQEVMGIKGTVELAADLGYGVLNAKVETVGTVVCEGGDLDKPATWFRLAKTGKKIDTLRAALVEGEENQVVSIVTARRFKALPSNVCGYWMSERLAKAYQDSRPICAIADIKQGTATADDFRFLRAAWEVDVDSIGLSRCWARFAKGGEFCQFYDDVHLIVQWSANGKQLASFPKAYIRNPSYYGRSGVTWPLRNQKFGPRALPSGCAFGHKGPSAFPLSSLPSELLMVLNSRAVGFLLSIRVGIVDDDPRAISPAFEVGLIRDLPWPSLNESPLNRLAEFAASAVEIVRIGQIEDDGTGETVVAFAVPPALLPLPDGTRPTSLEAATRARVAVREDRLARLAAIQAEIDTIVADAYGFSERDRQVMDEELEPALTALPGSDPIDPALFTTAYLTKNELDGDKLPGGKDAEMDVRVEHRRKKQVRLRDETALCRVFQAPPKAIAELRRRLGLLRDEDKERAAADIVSYAVGVAFGRWDIRLWQHPEWIPTFADPFDPLPPCPLGQLVNQEGLPATSDRISSDLWLQTRGDPTRLPQGPRGSYEFTSREYPIDVAWGGLAGDDTLHDARGLHPAGTFLARVESVLEHLFGDGRPAWEHDITRALGVRSIAEWLRAPSGFFADHLSRYSKSRRQAPIYWPISTTSGGFVQWIYAPRFNAGTLPLVVNRLRANLEELRDEQARLRAAQAAAKVSPSDVERLARIEGEISERTALHAELDGVLRWGYEPHADDGFIVTAAPLHFAFRLPKWRDALRATWSEFEGGAYDWAHLAMRRRPTEVLKKCATDLSIAIAHGKEELYQAPEQGKKKRASKAKPAAATSAAKAAPKPATKAVSAQIGLPGVGGEGEP